LEGVGNRRGTDMGFLRSKKGSIISDYFCAADDIGPFSRGDVVEIALYANHLELTEKSVGKKAAAVALPYTRITGVVYRSEVRTAEKDKSPVKRAVVGYCLAAPVRRSGPSAAWERRK
jgi:hypothetical protein